MSFSHRNFHRHTGTRSRHPADGEFATQHHDSLSQTQEFERYGRRIIVRKASAVIADFEDEPTGLFLQGYPDDGGSGMASDISQQLLNNPKESCRQFSIDSLHVLDRNDAPKPGTMLEGRGLPLNRRCQTELI